jgi:hypothetical protein
MWALYLLARCLDCVWRWGTIKRYLPQWSHGSLLLFVLGAMQIMYCWHLEPSVLPKSYGTWISKMGGLDDRIVTGTRQIIDKVQPVSSISFASWCKDQKIPHYQHKYPNLLPCDVFHPLEPRSCTVHAAKRWLIGFRDALPLYSFVHLMPLVLFRLRALLSAPLPMLARTVSGIFCSTAFLTSFQAIYWTTFCTGRSILGADSRAVSIASGTLAGLSLLWEKPSRRAELALFCIPRCVDSLYLMGKTRGWLRPVPHAHTLMFSGVMAVLMYFYQHYPHAYKPTYLNLLVKFFGK